ncbi:hypothetical protein LCGC14_1172340, partial [marine sediment metagenome]
MAELDMETEVKVILEKYFAEQLG